MVNNHVLVGSGQRKVLALSGWLGSAEGWGFLPALVDHERFTYAFMDYRGYGGSMEVDGEHTIEEIAGDTLALADFLGWERFSLLGHSMGGSPVQRVLVDAPDRVERLVGISPVPATRVPFDDQGWALFSGAADNADNRRAIIDLTTGNRLSAVWLDQMVQHSVQTSTRDAFAAYLEAWAKADFADLVMGNTTPVKVIVGEHDPSLGATAMEQTWLRFYPNAEMEVLANAGHYAMFETPVRLVTSIEDFLGA